MPTARLFASIAEAAGVKEIAFDADTLGAFLDAAKGALGHRFAEQLPHCRVLVNGEGVDGSTPITDADEIAILPPVSGGAAARR